MAWLFDTAALLAKNPLTVFARYAAKTLIARRAFPGFQAHYLASWKACDFEPNVTLFQEANVSSSSIGRHSYIGVRSRVHLAKIGRYCSIGPEVFIGLGRHPTHSASTHPRFYSVAGDTGRPLADRCYFEEHAETRIGHDVWIGARAIVRDGVTIGDGAIIGAGAVVTKDVRPYAVVGGVPARLLRVRFDPQTVSFLQGFRWWDRDEAWLREHYRELLDPQELMARYGDSARSP